MYRVLLVDGDSPFLRATKELLERDGGLRVEACADISRAIDVLGVERFDAVVSEFEVEASSGMDLLRDMRQNGNLTPFIVYTSSDHPSVGILTLNGGGDFLVRKGSDPAEAVDSLREAIHRFAAKGRGSESARTAKLAIDASLTAMLILDRELNVHYANEAYLRLVGLPRAEEVVGRSIFDVTPIGEGSRQELTRHLARHGRWNGTVDLPRADGTATPVELSVLSARAASGDPSYIIVSFLDLKEKRNAEEALRENEVRFRSFVERSADGIAFVDEDGSVVEWNEAMERITGYSREEIVGRPSWEVQSMLAEDGGPERAEGLRTIIEEALRTGRSPVFEHLTKAVVRRSDRQLRQVQQTIFPMRTRRGFYLGSITRDVTEERINQKALEESESRLRFILDNIHTGVFVIDPQTHEVVDANPAALAMMGAAREEVVGSACHGLVCPTERGMCPVTDLQQGVHNAEGVLLRADGKPRPIIKSVATVRLKGKEYLLESFVDISERKRAEEALRDSEKKFRDIFDHVSDAIFIHSPEGRILEANAVAVERLEYDRDDLLEMNIVDITAPEANAPYPELLEKIMRGRPTLFKSVTRTKAGRRVSTEVNSRVMVYDGMPAILSVSRDITEKIRAERALAEKETRFSDIVETIPEIVWEMDFHGVITYVNKRCQEVIGYSPEELLGLSSRDLYRFENDTMAKRFMELCNEVKPFGPIERTVLHRDGHAVYLESSGVPIFNEEEVFRGYRGVDRDISRRKRMERRLRQKEALLRAIIDQSPFGIYVLGSQANGILYFNHRFCEMWGIERLEEGMRRGDTNHLEVMKNMAPHIQDSAEFILEWKDLQERRRLATVRDEIKTNDGRVIRRFSAPVLGEAKEFFGRMYIFQE